jgi:hypothetical protein
MTNTADPVLRGLLRELSENPVPTSVEIALEAFFPAGAATSDALRHPPTASSPRCVPRSPGSPAPVDRVGPLVAFVHAPNLTA